MTVVVVRDAVDAVGVVGGFGAGYCAGWFHFYLFLGYLQGVFRKLFVPGIFCPVYFLSSVFVLSEIEIRYQKSIISLRTLTF